jgi:phage terminase Nu1 subunit (DNA packaging protein)
MNKPTTHDRSIPALVNRAQFAKLVGMSTGAVSAALDAGMPVLKRAARSGAEVRIDVARAVRWLIKRRAEKPDSALLRVASERAEHLRIKNARARRELIPVAEVQLAFHGAAAWLVQACEAMPQRVSSDEAVQAAVRNECRVLRDGFANYFEAFAGDDDQTNAKPA